MLLNYPNQIPSFLFEAIKKYHRVSFNDGLILKTTDSYNIKFHRRLSLFINLEKVNNILRINLFHEAVNKAVINGSIYCSCAETKEQRSMRKWKKKFFLISHFTLFVDFIFKRVIPKLPIAKKIYFSLTRGHNRVMTKTEIIGRLNSCGFDVLDIIEHNNLSYVISKKVSGPYYDMNPSYGPIFKMKRVGHHGRIISVYKFRTMSPYSEYVQKDIINKNKLDETGKINNDYRVTFYGKFLRKYWIDEFPMILNWIKRDLKMVGVRPLSEDYFKRYPKDLRELRIKTKPGLVPPYYVDLPVNFEEICESERKYLRSYFKHPLKTDLNYFIKAFYNIVIKRKRSG